MNRPPASRLILGMGCCDTRLASSTMTGGGTPAPESDLGTA
jgi:hypothetical protein